MKLPEGYKCSCGHEKFEMVRKSINENKGDLICKNCGKVQDRLHENKKHGLTKPKMFLG